jgi:signal transduction histidine kinase
VAAPSATSATTTTSVSSVSSARSSSATLGSSPLTSRWERLLEATRRQPKRTDIGLAVGFTVAMVLSIWGGYLTSTPEEVRTYRWWGVPVSVIAMVPIAWRRKYPEIQFIVSFVLYIVGAIALTPDGIVGFVWLWLGFYGLGCYGGRYRTHVRALGAIGIVSALIFFGVLEDTQPQRALIPFLLFQYLIIAGFVASAWLFGDTTRIRRQQAVDLALRARELELERDRNAERAVTEERLRIARELHDVMAHHVTVIGIQASAAERMIDRDVSQARSSLRLISSESRETVEELQRLLGFLRPISDIAADGPTPPQPSLENLERLVADSRATGLDVSLQTTGDLASLPGSVSLSGYRIVQEAITNIRKHAMNSRASVGVEVANGWVVVRVHNTAVRGPAPDSNRVTVGSGLGLVGMRERARLVGGGVVTGPSSDGGWLVEARLPVQAAPIA